MNAFRVATVLVSVGFLLAACNTVGSKDASLTSTTKTEVDGEITVGEYAAGLAKAKFLLTQNPFLNDEEKAIGEMKDNEANREKAKEMYEDFTLSYVNHPKAHEAIKEFYYKLFDVTDSGEPSNLPAYLYFQQKDFREFVTADYCVADYSQEFESYETYTCLNSGQVTNNDNTEYQMELPPEFRAGFMTTQGWLKKYDGAKNFRRIAKVMEFALCAEPSESGETEGWSEAPGATDPADIDLHPFYWNSFNQVPGMNCTQCHGTGGLNQGRLAFTGFGEDGEIRMGQTVATTGAGEMEVPALTINDVERSVIGEENGSNAEEAQHAVYLDNFGDFGFNYDVEFEPTIGISFLTQPMEDVTLGDPNDGDPSYSSTRDLAQAVSQSPKFPRCVANHMFQMAKYGQPKGLDFNPEGLSRAIDRLSVKFVDSGYSIRKLVYETLNDPVFLNL